METVQLSLDEALRRRDYGLELLEERYPIFLERARAAARIICNVKGTVTADDVRAVLSIPPDVHPNTMGALFQGPQWEFMGWERSSQPQRHGNRAGRWRLKE